MEHVSLPKENNQNTLENPNSEINENEHLNIS